jgi:hypothetical protein
MTETQKKWEIFKTESRSQTTVKQKRKKRKTEKQSLTTSIQKIQTTLEPFMLVPRNVSSENH